MKTVSDIYINFHICRGGGGAKNEGYSRHDLKHIWNTIEDNSQRSTWFYRFWPRLGMWRPLGKIQKSNISGPAKTKILVSCLGREYSLNLCSLGFLLFQTTPTLEYTGVSVKVLKYLSTNWVKPLTWEGSTRQADALAGLVSPLARVHWAPPPAPTRSPPPPRTSRHRARDGG